MIKIHFYLSSINLSMFDLSAIFKDDHPISIPSELCESYGINHVSG